MFKSIFIPLSDTSADDAVIKAAVNIATHMHGYITMLHGTILPLVVPGGWGVAPELEVVSQYPAIRLSARQKTEKLRARLKKEQVPITVEEVETYDLAFDDIAADKALCADLVVVSSLSPRNPRWDASLHMFQTLLAKSGRPVLVVPMGAELDMPPVRVLVAWKASPQAARAMHDALPFLSIATAVDVLHVAEDGEVAAPLDPDPVAYLQRRGIQAAHIDKVKPSTVATGHAILLHAHERGANLIVAGGYGHSKFREWALGGATRDMFSKSALPVLFSH